MVAALFCSLTLMAQETAPKPAISPEPLSAERIGIYRQFLAGYHKDLQRKLNVATTTEPFSPDDNDLKDCLKRFRLGDHSTQTLHSFQADAFPNDQVILVDPKSHKKQDPEDAMANGVPVDDAVEAGFAAGIFSFSEIVFDASHTHAAFSFSFFCGRLCGHGWTAVYDLKQGKWHEDSHAICAHWIS